MSESIQPQKYRLHVIPHFATFRFQGNVEIDLTAAEAVQTVVLDAHQLAIWECRLVRPEEEIACAFAVDPAAQTLTITLPQAIEGEFVLRVDYAGRINDQMAGFYRSRYLKEGREYFIAVTQFQESDARRALPCMDHPGRKAVFELLLTVPADLSVLANTAAIKEKTLEGGFKQVEFAPSPRMSTYLLFFGVGEFAQVEDPQDRRVRVVHLPGLAHTTERGLTFGREALQFCEDYFDIPYPLSKLDLIAVPDFAFGAMENWGAITFRENLLLHFAEHTSTAGIQRICEIIAHEIAHQWFGNLVTPSSWKYLWLNESFATYFAYGVVAHHHPRWQVWEQFLRDETAVALSRDGLQENCAIEIPGDRQIAINVSTAPIIYNKGASILRMIEGHIGPERYQQGVRAYLHRHRYGCAESRDLWNAFENASSLPITAMMQSWIGQPGHPLVSAHRSGNTIALRQQRFTYLNVPSEQTWLIPIRLRLWNGGGAVSEQALIMQDAAHSIDIPADTIAYKLNADQTGFFRSAYQNPENLNALGRLVVQGRVNAIDRWGLQSDRYAQLRRGDIPLTDYLAFLEYYENETAYLPLAGIADHLQQLFLIAPTAMRPTIAAAGLRLAEPVLDQIGLLPADQEPQTTTMLRDQLLWQATLWGSAKAADFTTDQFRNLTTGRPVHPDIARAVVQAGALIQGAPALAWLCDRFETSPSEHERLNILGALTAFQDWDLVDRALAYGMQKVPPRNRHLPIVAAAHNPFVQDRLWEWYQNQLGRLDSFHPLLYERVIVGLWPYAGLHQGEIQINGFSRRYIQKRPEMGDAIRLALESLEINRSMRRRMETQRTQ
jgi:aminopeptidase N